MKELNKVIVLDAPEEMKDLLLEYETSFKPETREEMLKNGILGSKDGKVVIQGW